MKFQALTAPDRFILHSYEPIKGLGHDWTVYTKSHLEEKLPECLTVNNSQYFIYGNNDYARGQILKAPFQGMNLAPE